MLRLHVSFKNKMADGKYSCKMKVVTFGWFLVLYRYVLYSYVILTPTFSTNQMMPNVTTVTTVGVISL